MCSFALWIAMRGKDLALSINSMKRYFCTTLYRPMKLAVSAHIGIDHCRLIAPVDLRVFFFGALLDLRIALVEPLLHCNRRLLIGAADRILRRETTALEILAHATHRKANAALTFDQKHDGGPRPQSEIELQLLGALVRNHAHRRITQTKFARGLAPIHSSLVGAN